MWKLSCVLLLLPFVSCSCPPNATEAFGQCYVATRMLATWSAAEGVCQNLGGHLATSKNMEQNDFLHKLIHKKNVSNAWLGHNAVKGVWSNSDGSFFSYTNFTSPPMNKLHRAAATMGISSGKWTEQLADNSTLHMFICQFPSCNFDNSLPKSLLPKANVSGLIFSNVTNSFYYTSGFENVSISVAESECNELGGHLPTISNVTENECFRNISTVFHTHGFDVKFSLGYASDRRGVWHWNNGKSAGYTNWDPKANIAVADSKALFDAKTGLWSTSSDKPNLFICQFPLGNRKIC